MVGNANRRPFALPFAECVCVVLCCVCLYYMGIVVGYGLAALESRRRYRERERREESYYTGKRGLNGAAGDMVVRR